MAHSPRRGTRVHNTAAMAWKEMAGGHVRQKAIRNEPDSGRFLALMGLDALTRTGVHKHLDVAFSFHLAGSSTNYTSTVRAGQLGITLAGTVHETIVYDAALCVVRTEGPTMFPADGGREHLHVGAVHGELSVADPEVVDCLVVDVPRLPSFPTTIRGLSRRMLFDYLGTGKDRRAVELLLLPQSKIPGHRTTATVEWFVLAGDVVVNGETAGPADFVIMDPDAEVRLESRYGARILAWADGPVAWADAPGGRASDLYGFAVPSSG